MFRIRLKELREKAGYSQYSFADKFNVSQSAIASWEAGTREPKFDTMQKLADFFGVSVDYLLGREEIKKAPAVAEAEKISDPDELLGLALYNKYGTVTKEDMEDAKKVLDVFFGRRDKNENDG